ncbi:ABC transporter substrate-binding protein [Caenimonas sedimenti]|uniref:ABC transporter substrate-binding protein n=1 Tax=Caenimonas sedimenti TaxID=2596921 RepID=A0A562ZF37_9BURK|nr:substrate-binding domain-containing protein [Caenimonas sedimenti]TWO66161.1 ABC transporter substrate-binding protein [Caenimonas sedimenti]
MKTLHILSGGAAHALVRALQPAFEARHGCRIEGTFGAVGLMKDKLLGGEPCDLLILSAALIRDLAAQDHAVAGSARDLGVAKTGVAVRAGAAEADIGSPEALKALLERASGIYFPDPAKATAGIHFMKVLQGLGLAEAAATRLHTFPNGATAMGALAKAPDLGAVGCTQVTEILDTPGVRLLGLLPPPYELATVYTAAVAARAAEPELAAALAAALSDASAEGARKHAGFEPA